MEKDMMTRFQVIGACLHSQVVTWETELKLIDGVTCDIDLDQDFSSDIGYKVRLSNYSAAEAIDFLKKVKRLPDTPPTRLYPYDQYGILEDLRHPKKAMKRYEKERERELWGDVKKRKKRKKKNKKSKESWYLIEK